MPRPGHPYPPHVADRFYRQNVDPHFPQGRLASNMIVASRLVPRLKTRVSIYTARQLNLDRSEGTYRVICERHGLEAAVYSREEAFDLYNAPDAPTFWCVRCRANEYMLKRLRAVKERDEQREKAFNLLGWIAVQIVLGRPEQELLPKLDECRFTLRDWPQEYTQPLTALDSLLRRGCPDGSECRRVAMRLARDTQKRLKEG